MGFPSLVAPLPLSSEPLRGLHRRDYQKDGLRRAEEMESKCADDTTPYDHRSPRNLIACENEMNGNTHFLEEWAKDSNPQLNKNKTKQMLITCNVIPSLTIAIPMEKHTFQDSAAKPFNSLPVNL
ncbi:unnamed protein product, partial [Porites evermanni]